MLFGANMSLHCPKTYGTQILYGLVITTIADLILKLSPDTDMI